jgi:photosystem II stability/assembly factor-like uncharacterized protein
MKNITTLFLSALFFFLLPAGTRSQPYELIAVETTTAAHFRAVSVVDDLSVWVSGSKGTFGRTIDGGKSWKFSVVKNFEKLEFRSLYAFDSLNAVIANAGAPAYVLRTEDGGKNWKVVYTNEHQEAFIDGMDFWNNREGIVYGDAIEGRMLLLKSGDGGLSWQEFPKDIRPVLKDGEGSFAASGTGIRCFNDKNILIATGGRTSRLWASQDKGSHWNVLTPPIIQGKTMTGIFSVAFSDADHWVIVGGNYEIDSLKTDHVFLTSDAGKNWKPPAVPTGGLRECVEFIDRTTALSSGLNGIDISYDGGMHWQSLSDEKKFSVVRKSRKGLLIVLAGANGKVALLKNSNPDALKKKQP